LSDTGKLKRTYKGVQYDSVLEMQYFKEVIEVGLENGSIKDYKRQVKYELQPKYKYNDKNILAINYIADYVLIYKDNSEIVWDVKGGMVDPLAKLKKKLFHYKYPEIDYRWVGRSVQDGGWLEYSELERLRKERKKVKNKLSN
jgi:hypothetical protein